MRREGGELLTDFRLGNPRLLLSCGLVSLSWQNTLEPEWRATGPRAGRGTTAIQERKDAPLMPVVSQRDWSYFQCFLKVHFHLLHSPHWIVVKPRPHPVLQLSVNNRLLASTTAVIRQTTSPGPYEAAQKWKKLH